jgi:hypothetical protein
LIEEAAERSWSVRTKRNVEESDGTLIFAVDQPLNGGTKLTADHARRKGKPPLVLLRKDGEAQEQKLRGFIVAHQIKRLNVAGPRARRSSHHKNLNLGC